ncbi:protein-tyrosine phosphatase family protein [Methylovulum psychrotolerans]|uniref:Protein tyrosine phosphatase n=1 Tax=Methylovulum psychrotolerans TaxID=1704499 RepID=A0A1Z4C2C5_9GAMM|nr:protein tyrosine phosphatase [Methylovulum psychrotolerans]
MRPDLYWLPLPGYKLAIMPRPRAGDWLADEIRAWQQQGINTVVSLLEASEVHELELGEEERLCADLGIRFLSLPIPDRGIPAHRPAVRALAYTLAAQLQAGASVAIHCRAGIGRSSLIAACVLAVLGIGDEFALISQARGVAVPDTEQQAAWLVGFRRTEA